jgi:hypothetical protein
MPMIRTKRMDVLFLELRFAHVHTLLLNRTSSSGTGEQARQREQIAVFEMLSLDFLRSRGITVEKFTVSEQSVQNKPEHPRVRRLATEDSSWPETNATVQPLFTPNSNFSSTFVELSSTVENDSLPGILILRVHIIATAERGIEIVETLRDQWSVYVSFVSNVIAAEGNKSRDDIAWLISAMVASLAALAAVVLVRRRLRQTLRRKNLPSTCGTTNKKETHLGGSEEHHHCGSVDELRSDRGNSSGSQHDDGHFELEFADMDLTLLHTASEQQRRVEGTLVSV